uniref:Uncharacterized protein n=1 Tax=Sander lucioperca TaxID=283035 RepID=A0A8C9X1S7_SANLU
MSLFPCAGSPYRHEVLETTINTRKKAVMWTGEHGFCDPLKGENQVFYPTPPKTVLPNPKLRDWDLSISERTSNMLKNLERTQWLTSYQMHHTGTVQTLFGVGSGPESSISFTELFCSPHVAKHTFINCDKCSFFSDRHSSPIISVQSLSKKLKNKNTEYILLLEKMKASLQSSNRICIESNVELSLRASSEQEKLAKGREPPHSISNPCILPRMDRVGNVGREGAALRLLDLQNSFSKTKAHRNFNSSITRAAVNLRDNVVTGKKHDFYGINCYYLHG